MGAREARMRQEGRILIDIIRYIHITIQINLQLAFQYIFLHYSLQVNANLDILSSALLNHDRKDRLIYIRHYV